MMFERSRWNHVVIFELTGWEHRWDYEVGPRWEAMWYCRANFGNPQVCCRGQSMGELLPLLIAGNLRRSIPLTKFERRVRKTCSEDFSIISRFGRDQRLPNSQRKRWTVLLTAKSKCSVCSGHGAVNYRMPSETRPRQHRCTFCGGSGQSDIQGTVKDLTKSTCTSPTFEVVTSDGRWSMGLI